VSATSRDLGSFRRAVSDVLITLDVLPVVQDHFAPDSRTVVEMLREKITLCDVVICLIGRAYGREPLSRTGVDRRRSYTQLEYDTAIELEKPVFVFVASDDCPVDVSPEDAEPVELQSLQTEHLKQIVAGQHIWMPFHSLAHLGDQVRLMRFDPESLAQGLAVRLAVLLSAELAGGPGCRAQKGEAAWVRDVLQPFHKLLQEILRRHGGSLQAEMSGDHPQDSVAGRCVFETAGAAVNASLALQEAFRKHNFGGQLPELRLGIHVGEIIGFGGADESRVLYVSQALNVCRALTRVAIPGQTLLTRTAFDIARANVREAPNSAGAGGRDLKWCSHGRYIVAGFEESLDVYEVGVAGEAPLKAPADSVVAQRADSLEELKMQGWRPAIGQAVPRRPGWVLESKLGEGGFGEVWVARQQRGPQFRVFKFCFDAAKLTSFKREHTLFRLLAEALGDRPDIARLLEWKLEEPPFYLESEFVKGGNLRAWGEQEGRLQSLPLDERLRLFTEIGAAVGAAHSIGIIHKDLKPTNIFMRQSPEGRWHPMLADFGIGALADRSQLEQRGITVAGFTHSLIESGSGRSGTRMYQPPEANLARPATVQGDVYALGILLYQMIIGDFDQPLGHGWERRLELARTRTYGEAGRLGSIASKPTKQLLGAVPNGGKAPPQTLEAVSRLVFELLQNDIAVCVDGDPATRLASVAQLTDRLKSLNRRVTERLLRHRHATGVARSRRVVAGLAVALAALAVVGPRSPVSEWSVSRLAASLAALAVVAGLSVFAFRQLQRAEFPPEPDNQFASGSPRRLPKPVEGSAGLIGSTATKVDRRSREPRSQRVHVHSREPSD
jgi:serine/threonine protein kinase